MPLFLATGADAASPAITLLFALILIALIACLALEEKLHAKKSIIAGAFAVLCLLLGTATGILRFQDVIVETYPVRPPQETVELEYIVDAEHEETATVKIGPADEPPRAPDVPAGEVDELQEIARESELYFGGHRIKMPVYIPGVDWSVIVIILGSSLFVDVTSKSGLFTWIAIRVTKLSRGDPLRLLWFYGAMTVVFSAVLNNVTAMIIVGSLTVVSLEKLNLRNKLLAFLLVEALLTNVGGLLTLISSVPNIIVGTTADINFLTFFVKSAPFVVGATAATLWLGARKFDIRPIQGASEQLAAAELVQGFDETEGIPSWRIFRFSAAMLALFIVLIAGTSAIPVINKLGMGFVAASMAVIMLVVYRAEVDKFYRAVDWDLLGFFIALFIVIYVMEHAMVLDAIGRALQAVLISIDSEAAHPVDATVLLVGSAGFSSVTDNIPLSAMLASVLHDLGAPNASGLWWSVIFGCNLGGNLTPIGSASTLVAVTIMHRHKVAMSFLAFVKLAALFALMQIVLAVVYVLVVIPWIPAI